MDAKEFTEQAAARDRAEIKQKLAREKDRAEEIKKLSRAQQAQQAARERQAQKVAEEAQRKGEQHAAGALRTKINAYFKSRFYGALLNANVEKPKPTARMEELEEKLYEIHTFLNSQRGEARLNMGLDMMLGLAETYYDRFPSPFDYNLKDVGPGKKYNALFHREMAPLIEEVLIEYPWISKAPLVLRVCEAMYGCVRMVDAVNRDPNLQLASELSVQPAKPDVKLPSRVSK